VSFDGKTIVVAVQPDVLPDYRSDEDLRRLTRKALAQCRWLTTDELRAITVDVDAGRVRLSGNVLAKSGKDAALAAAQAAVGDTLVNCDIIDDLSLETGIGLALHIAGLQRGAAIFTRATLGAVTLFGRAPSQPAVEETARTVERTPGVRSVSCRIEVRASPG
jgi:osmotically-inducible protein OsmY